MSRNVLPDSCSLPPQSERDTAAEAVQSDPELTAPEKELSVTLGADREYATVYSEIPSTVRRLRTHSSFGIETVRVSDAERFGKSLSWEQWRTDDPPITGVKGYVPIGAIKIQHSSRANNYPSSIVSDHGTDANGGDAR